MSKKYGAECVVGDRYNKLSEMSLEELWQLFPIELEPHNNEWINYYEEMKKLLCEHLGTFNIIINHIGSTAVADICAKPIIDILLEVENIFKYNEIEKILLKIGFIKMSETDKRMSFNYGYTINGFAKKVYHLHLRVFGDNDELYFRDYLNLHNDIAKEYENLKLQLWKKYRYNRDAYTEAKSQFVNKYTKLAKKELDNL